MAGILTTHDLGTATVETVAGAYKTIAYITAPSNHRLVIRKWYLGVRDHNQSDPLNIELAILTSAATSALGASKLTETQAAIGSLANTHKGGMGDFPETPQGSVIPGKSSGADANELVDADIDYMVDRVSVGQDQGGWTFSGGAIPIPGGKTLAWRVSDSYTSAQAVDFIAAIEE